MVVRGKKAMTEPMTKDKLRQIAEWVELIAYNEMSDPSSKFLVEAYAEIARLREREGDLECMLEKEQREHDETRGYRQAAENLTKEIRDAAEAALDLAERYGGIDGDHHKMWVIDQMVRALTGENYDAWVERYRDGEDGPDTYDWDTGIAP